MGDNQSDQGNDDQRLGQGMDGENWADSEEGINLYFVIFLTLLTSVLTCSKFLRDRPRVAAVLPEAGMIVVAGAASGALLSLAFGSPSRDDDGAAVDDDDDGRRNEFVLEGLLSFSPTVFFFVLLPPIIFSSGYTLNHEVFFRHITPISLFACAGTAISTFVVAAFLALFSTSFGDFRPQFTELLAFGALIRCVAR